MQTHSIEFGRPRAKASSHIHGHMQKSGNRYVSLHPKSSGNVQHDKLVKETQKWVSQTFFGELLKQMRNSPFKSKIFSGGRGGEAFTEMFDQKLADKIARGSGHKLVDSIVNKIEANRAYGKTTGTAARHHPRAPRINSLSMIGNGGAA